jgi:hypothetical protein
MAGFFSWSEDLPLMQDGTFDLNNDQRERLKASNTDDKPMTDAEIDLMIAKINQEIISINATEEKDANYKALRAELAKMAEENGFSEDDLEKVAKDGSKGDLTAAQLELLGNNIKSMKEQVARLEALDTPEPKAHRGVVDLHGVQHSASHFLASGNDWDAVASRPWNAQAMSGKVVAGTDWGDKLNVERLQKDTDHFYRLNPDTIKSLIRDTESIPSFWIPFFGVSDRMSTASIVTGEVTQSRKLGWQAKNKQAIKAEEGRVFPIKIDLEFEGFELQKLESSWLQAWNKEGSQAYKKSFIEFLLMDIVKTSNIEQRVAMVNGVYSPVPENLNIPGKSIHIMDGILIQFWRAFYIDKKYKVARIEAPTPANILDHEKALIEKNLKEDVINTPNLVLYMSPSWLRRRMERKRLDFASDNNYTGQELLQIESHPNIEIHPLRDLEGTDFMFITFKDNIRPLVHVANEENVFTFDSLKRQFFIMADFKKGIMPNHIGNKVADGDPDSFKVQSVWTNGQPMFNPNFKVTVYDDNSGNLTALYSNMRVDGSWTKDISELKGQFPGQIIKLSGNTDASGNLKDNANNDLASDFPLGEDKTITLLVQDNLSVKELKREDNSDDTAQIVEFDATVIDSLEGHEFRYIGTGAKTLVNITDPTEQQSIRIYGNASGALTISNVPGVISVGAGAVLDTAAEYIDLTVVDGVFTETKRNIA